MNDSARKAASHGAAGHMNGSSGTNTATTPPRRSERAVWIRAQPAGVYRLCANFSNPGTCSGAKLAPSAITNES
jgi:hypothetical protein